ncbi:MAG: hypothetical protein IPF95_03565 [Flavobacteriales bacterium]|jgi:hypothetical protein|nr:hypothetical protein [Flavobacteriales bacterium]
MLRSAAHAITLFCCILFWGAVGIAQPSASALNRIQTVVEGVRTPQHAHQAAIILRARPGVVMCRVDHNTRNILLHVDPACTLSETEMNVLLAPVEMSVHCFTRSPSIDAPFRKLDPKNCGILPPRK